MNPRHYGFGDQLTDLYLQASAYAKKKEQAEAMSDQTKFYLMGGAGLAALLLVGLILARR